MPSRSSDKCRLCSKLSLEQALQKHGPEGTGCWEGEPCHKRRTYYKHRDRYNRSRRIKYKADKQSVTQLKGIPIPTIPAVVIYFYRQRKDAQLHALRAELWVGQQKKASYPAIHTLGWAESQVKNYIREVVSAFSQEYGVQIGGIATTVELDPYLCPLIPCPLKVVEDEGETFEASIDPCKQ